MATVQVVIDAPLLRAADRAARRQEMNRSSLVRQALREHLEKLRLLELERGEKEAYLKHPEDLREGAFWQKVAAWPDE